MTETNQPGIIKASSWFKMTAMNSGFLLIGLAYLAFISLGLPDGLLGVAWPSMRAFFDLPLDALGPLLVMLTGGYLLASLNCGGILAHLNVGALLALSCLTTALSLVGYALAPGWGIIIALGLLAGMGAGAIDTGLNTYAATHFSARSVNWLHACYGIGATLGPIIMTTVLDTGHRWQTGYALVGIGQLVLALCFGATHKLWLNHPQAAELAQNDVSNSQNSDFISPASPTLTNTLRLPAVWLSIAVFFFYTGIEASAGAWSYSLFTEGRAIPTVAAGTWISVYWGALTAGRLLSGMIVSFVPVSLLLRICIMGIACGAALIWLNLTELVSFLGLALMGLFCAPIFPSMIATTPARLGKAHTANAVGFQMAAAVLGTSLLPGLIGVLARSFGLEIIGPGLFVAALVLLASYEMLRASSAKLVQNEAQAVA